MNMQSGLMFVLFIVCVISALDWLSRGEYADAIAFTCFGCGDLALAWAFWNGSSWSTP